MPYYVYIIQSEQDGSYYKGFSLDPLNRLLEHNQRLSHYTAVKIPWRLVFVQIFNEKRDALIRKL